MIQSTIVSLKLTYWVNISPISLLLGMLKWISINLTCTSKQEPCTDPLCKSQHVKSTHNICLVTIAVKVLKAHFKIHKSNQSIITQNLRFIKNNKSSIKDKNSTTSIPKDHANRKFW